MNTPGEISRSRTDAETRHALGHNEHVKKDLENYFSTIKVHIIWHQKHRNDTPAFAADTKTHRAASFDA